MYRTENFVGEAIRDAIAAGKAKREDFFVTTKISPFDLKSTKCRQGIEQCLSNLNIGYIDLLLIHWPGASGLK